MEKNEPFALGFLSQFMEIFPKRSSPAIFLHSISPSWKDKISSFDFTDTSTFGRFWSDPLVSLILKGLPVINILVLKIEYKIFIIFLYFQASKNKEKC